MPPAVVGTAGRYRVACPCPRAFPACTTPYLGEPDFCWLRQSPVLTCLQRMYNTVGINAPRVGASLAPYGSPGAFAVRGVIRSPACSSLPPKPRVCCSVRSLCAPLVPVPVYRAVLAGSCRFLWPLRALDYVAPVLFWSAALQRLAAPILLAYLALLVLSQWITFLKVTCAHCPRM